MASFSTKPASGFRDFLPPEAAIRLNTLETISETAQHFGFHPIMMPGCEKLETLLGKGGGTENEKLLFPLLKRGDALSRSLSQVSETKDTEIANAMNLADLGLRFDLTLPLARYYARFRNELPRPFKALQYGSVWRAERAQKGRYREFVQCDMDVIGTAAATAEIEVLNACLSIFKKLSLPGITVKINDRRLLLAIGKSLGIDEDTWNDILISIDKLDKIGQEKLLVELKEKTDKAEAIVDLFFAAESLNENQYQIFSAYDAESVANIQLIINSLQDSYPNVKFEFAASLVRGQDYYTGTIFEFRHNQLSGSLGGGGRYDKLLSMFGTESIPCFGGSIGFERLLLLMEELGLTRQYTASLDIVFLLFETKDISRILPIANSLRAKNLRVDVYSGTQKLKQQFRYADQLKTKFVLILGEDEWLDKKIKVKELKTGQEQSIALDDLVSTMESLCRN